MLEMKLKMKLKLKRRLKMKMKLKIKFKIKLMLKIYNDKHGAHKSVGIRRTRLGHHNFSVVKQQEDLSKFQQQGLRFIFVKFKYSTKNERTNIKHGGSKQGRTKRVKNRDKNM